ncbi:MAG: RNA-binding protein [Halobacteriota archaeon]|nr:RNA-binding protein [Halobacteriota archaeon]
MKVKSRHYLRKSAAKKMIREVKTAFGEEISRFEGAKIEIVETDCEYDIILIDGEPILFIFDGVIFPTVKGASEIIAKNRKVVIDMGAVKYIAKGANVMCPGITYADEEIRKGDLVVITDETHDKAIAIGRALISGDRMVAKEGKAVKCIHYAGDKLWNFISTLQD